MDSKREIGKHGELSSISKRRGHGDTSHDERSVDKSQRDLFYSALSNKYGANKGRPHIANVGSGLGTYSTINSN